MLRVLHVVTDMGCGGLETMLMNYYRKVDKNQIQFDFLVHRSRREIYDDEIESFGGCIYRMPRLNPFSSEYKKKMGDFFETHPQYQIVHVHQDCLSGVILKIAKEHGVKHRIAHSHSSSQTKDVKYPIKLYFKRSIPKYATILMACSKEAGDWMFGGSKYLILNNAIDAKLYVYNEAIRNKIREVYKIEDNEILIGHVGRFSPPKNHMFLIEIFAELQKRVPAKLILVGDGNLRKKIEDKIDTLHIEKKVILTGRRSDVANLLQAMDVFLFPSIYEGLPLTIVEAQASGLPCLISDMVPIECKKTDLVYQLSLKDDILKWVECILELSKNRRDNKYHEIRNAGFDSVENAKQLMEFYYGLEGKRCE